MVQCPICWTPVKKDGLESHQQYSSYCAQWRKFQESGQKAEKGQQGKDDEDVKKNAPTATGSSTSGGTSCSTA